MGKSEKNIKNEMVVITPSPSSRVYDFDYYLEYLNNNIKGGE